MKKLLFTILAMMLPVVASASEYYDAKIDGIYYRFDTSTKMAYVACYYPNASLNKDAYVGDYVIPCKVMYDSEEYTVRGISQWAFIGCTKLNSITIPNSITVIDNQAFSGCMGLASIEIPNSVTAIGDNAFSGCSGLTSLTIGSGVETIGTQAFANCSHLTDVYCLAENVPDMREYDYPYSTCTDIFEGSNIENATLHVPASSVSSYSSTYPWSDFGNIKAIEVYFTLTINSGVGGHVLFNTNEIVNDSQDFVVESSEPVELTFVPDEGFELNSVVVNGSNMEVTNNTYMIENVSENIEIVVKFKYVNTSYPVTMAGTIQTFCSIIDLDFTNVLNLKAYIVSGFSPSTGEVLLTRIYKIPAGEGLLLKGNAGDYEVPYVETDMHYTNLLKGVTKATTISPTDGDYTNFILASGSHGIGFYTLSQTGEIAAGKAYLQLPTSAVSGAGSHSIKMRFDDEDSNPTAVKGIEDQQANIAEYYDLQGRKVRDGAARRGMYIIQNASESNQGKKVFIRK